MRDPDTYQLWTPHCVAALLGYRAKGLTIPQIATRMRRTDDSVRTKLKLLKAPRKSKVRVRPSKPITTCLEMMAVEKDRVCELYTLGWRFEQFSNDGLCVMRKERRL